MLADHLCNKCQDRSESKGRRYWPKKKETLQSKFISSRVKKRLTYFGIWMKDDLIPDMIRWRRRPGTDSFTLSDFVFQYRENRVAFNPSNKRDLRQAPPFQNTEG